MSRSPDRRYGMFRTIVIGALLALALGMAPPAGSVPSSIPDTSFVTDGPVHAVARSADTIYLGGDFGQVAPRTGPWVALSASTGEVDRAMPQFSGSSGGDGVRATVSDGAGGFFVGGDFSRVGGLPRNNLVHILADKSVDPAWDPNVNGAVNAMVLSGSTLYIGGSFNGADSVNGNLTRNRLAALDTTTGVATGWDPDSNSVVLAMAKSGPTIYVGGNFSTINGTVARIRAAGVDATTGTVTAWDPNVNGSVRALAVSGSTVYLGGDFNGTDAINGNQPRARLGSVDATTGVATTWAPTAN